MLLTLRIQLDNISDPPVWRKLTVPAEFSFDMLHLVIQAAFGWENSHMYQFSENGYGSSEIISLPYDELGDRVKDSEEIELSQIFKKVRQKYMYIYDFGDDWKHNITVEKIEDVTISKADCISGEGACPPEDCGGPWGYGDLKETLADPEDTEYVDMKEWLGLEKNEEWNTHAFDLEKTRAAISNI